MVESGKKYPGKCVGPAITSFSTPGKGRVQDNDATHTTAATAAACASKCLEVADEACTAFSFLEGTCSLANKDIRDTYEHGGPSEVYQRLLNCLE